MLNIKSDILKGKKIVVCVTGSIAAIETPKLVRELRRMGAEVHCVMSDNSQQIIHPYVLEWASDNEVVTKITGKVEHVKLTGEVPDRADLILIAPATSNTIGKIAYGIDDTPVTTVATTAFGNIPIVIVPSMHISMYNHPILQENIKKLKQHGVEFIEPRIEENKAKFPDVQKIINHVVLKFTKKDLKGKKILVTAGATIEDIDEVRYIINRSSGKTGVWLAEEAYKRGADVILIRGKTSVEPVYPFKDVKVRSANDMFNAIKDNITVDIVIHSAAVSDYTTNKKDEKISSENKINLELLPTTKIFEKIKDMNKDVFLIGFKAEYKKSKEELIEGAYNKLKLAKADLIVSNDIGRKDAGFEVDTNEVYVVDSKKNVKQLKLAHKRVIANQILDMIK
ncbi:MAG: bifunctional phosphopantothenoylcysteine decarboxylase/phosphopantothenate--cysteine ligase CoaBC [Candidatus Aenigmarchaeota archaeon]|nr:bifunctional phosphopantothenoylcysteine decarboxylase/phosphopantothenate--cysteine ligase CoaBC [Candidatus Aenigmarchaeota archaeon]